MNDFVILTWANYLQNFEGHGARIKYSNNEIEYSSPLLPPGTNIYTWSSQLGFQDTRSQGELPILIGDRIYCLDSCLTTKPADSAYFKITMYNYEGQVVNEKILPASGGEFLYPSEAQQYQIALVVKANQAIKFSYLVLAELQQFKTFNYQISKGLTTTVVQDEDPSAINLFLAKRGASSWAVTPEPRQITVLFRLDDEEIGSEVAERVAISKLVDYFYEDCGFRNLPLRVYTAGYPMPKVKAIAREQIRIDATGSANI